MGEMPLMLCIVALSIFLLIVVALKLLVILCPLSPIASMAVYIQWLRASELPHFSPTMRVEIVVPLNSLGLHNALLRVVASSASLPVIALSAFMVTLGAHRMGGTSRIIVKPVMADQYPCVVSGTACGRVEALSQTRWRLVLVSRPALP